MPEMNKIKTTDLVFRDDLYPRLEPNQAQIQKYSDSIEFLPAIKINQNNILIDGFHRWKAHQLAGVEEISYEVIETESEKELKKLAYQLNSNHGLQLSNDEKRKYAQEMFGEMTVKELSTLLGVSESSIKVWTETQAKAQKEDRDRHVVELYLKAWNTQESIADSVGVTQPTIINIINNIKKSKIAEIDKNFKPLLFVSY